MKRVMIVFGLMMLTSCRPPPTSTPRPTPLIIQSSTPSPIASPTQTASAATSTIKPTDSANTPVVTPALESDYYFFLDRETVNVFWNADGSLSLSYELVFTNNLTASPIDFVDIYIPSDNFTLQNVAAQVDGKDVLHIEESTYFPGAIELGLEPNAIGPGETGVVTAQINHILDVLYVDLEDQLYVSAVFFPSWFEFDLVHGFTDMTVIFHLPPDTLESDLRFHPSPPGWPFKPTQGLDSSGQLTYSWQNSTANGYSQYLFGVSIPKTSVAENMIVSPEKIDGMVSEGFFQRGTRFSEIGEYQKAIADFSHAIYLDPTFSVAYYARGYSYGAVSEFEHAIDDFDVAIELDPSFAQAHFTRGLALSIMGDLERAITDYDQAITLDPEHALAYFNRGWAHADLNNREKAIADLVKAIELGLDLRTEQTAHTLLEELRE